MDRQLRGLERSASADPEARHLWNSARARLEGPALFLAPLADLSTWQEANEAEQDQAALEVSRRLGDDEWELLEPRIFSCPCRRECYRCDDEGCGQCDGRGWHEFSRENELAGGGLWPVQTNRIFVFRYKRMGAEFSLIPGHSSGCDECLDLFGAPKDDDVREEGEPCSCFAEPMLAARWPITNEQYNSVCFPKAHLSEEFKELPKVNYSYEKAEYFASLHGMRLPNLKEWERLARGGASSPFYWGDHIAPFHVDHTHGWPHVWLAENSGDIPLTGGNRLTQAQCECDHFITQHTAEYGCVACGCEEYDHARMTKPPQPRAHAPREHDEARAWNAFGLVDVIGNVWEVCQKEETSGGIPSIPIMGSSYLDSRVQMVRSWTSSRRHLRGVLHAQPSRIGDEIAPDAVRDAIERAKEDFADMGFRPVVDIPEAGS